MESKHTPTPWVVKDKTMEIFGVGPTINGHTFPELVAKEVHSFNAAFIVRAVNAHEELLEAAKEMRTEIARRTQGVVATAWDIAIAKAEGKGGN